MTTSTEQKVDSTTTSTEQPIDLTTIFVNKMVDFVKYPVITQKTYIALYSNRQYTFDVDARLTKPQIKRLFETLFDINVSAVNTHIPPRKKIRVGVASGFRPRYKRAIITLKEGQSINYGLFVEKTEPSKKS